MTALPPEAAVGLIGWRGAANDPKQTPVQRSATTSEFLDEDGLPWWQSTIGRPSTVPWSAEPDHQDRTEDGQCHRPWSVFRPTVFIYFVPGSGFTSRTESDRD